MAKLSDFILIGAIGLGAYAIYKWGGLGDIIGGAIGGIPGAVGDTYLNVFRDDSQPSILDSPAFQGHFATPAQAQAQMNLFRAIGAERKKTLAARRTVRGIGRHGKRFNLLLKARRSKGLSPGATRFIQQYQRKYYLMNKGKV